MYAAVPAKSSTNSATTNSRTRPDAFQHLDSERIADAGFQQIGELARQDQAIFRQHDAMAVHIDELIQLAVWSSPWIANRREPAPAEPYRDRTERFTDAPRRAHAPDYAPRPSLGSPNRTVTS